jgi:hypothetical protein
VRQWAQKGLIQARLTAGGHRRYTRAAVIDFARRMAIALPDGFVESGDTRVLVADDDRELNDSFAAFVRTQFRGIDGAQAYDAFDVGRQVARATPPNFARYFDGRLTVTCAGASRKETIRDSGSSPCPRMSAADEAGIVTPGQNVFCCPVHT